MSIFRFQEQIAELQAEETRCLRKIEARTRSIMSADPCATAAQAYARAVSQLPNCYENYVEARAGLAKLKVKPIGREDL